MKQTNHETLSKIHQKLIHIERELNGYAVLMGNLHEDASIAGDDLIGPSQALGKNSRSIQKILKTIDRMFVDERIDHK